MVPLQTDRLVGVTREMNDRHLHVRSMFLCVRGWRFRCLCWCCSSVYNPLMHVDVGVNVTGEFVDGEYFQGKLWEEGMR